MNKIRAILKEAAEFSTAFDPVDVVVAKVRYGKLRAFFYQYHTGTGRGADVHQTVYYYHRGDTTLAIMFCDDFFSLVVDEQVCSFYTGDPWHKTTDIIPIDSKFRIFDEMMEFISDYYAL